MLHFIAGLFLPCTLARQDHGLQPIEMRRRAHFISEYLSLQQFLRLAMYRVQAEALESFLLHHHDRSTTSTISEILLLGSACSHEEPIDGLVRSKPIPLQHILHHDLPLLFLELHLGLHSMWLRRRDLPN